MSKGESDVEFVKCFKRARFPFFKFTREKRNWEWMMFHSSIVTIVSFYTQNYYNSKYFVKSTTTLAWIWQITQKWWFFCVNSWQFCQSPFFLHELDSWLSATSESEEFVEFCKEQLWKSLLKKFSQKSVPFSWPGPLGLADPSPSLGF